MYLGETLKKMRLVNGKYAWASSLEKYIWAVSETVKRYLTDLGNKKLKVPSHCANPFAADYEPDFDESELLYPDLALWYASLIGML